MKSDLDKLRAIIEASKKLTSVLDIDELLNVILDVALTELEAERGTVFLLDRERGEIFSRILRGEEIGRDPHAAGQGHLRFRGPNGRDGHHPGRLRRRAIRSRHR